MAYCTVFLLAAFLGGSMAQGCAPGFTRMQSNPFKCYGYTRQSVRYDQAESTCEYYGGKLMTIESAFENQEFYNYGAHAWIGLQYNMQNGALSWADGSAVGYTNIDQQCCKDVNQIEPGFFITPRTGMWAQCNGRVPLFDNDVKNNPFIYSLLKPHEKTHCITAYSWNSLYLPTLCEYRVNATTPPPPPPSTTTPKPIATCPSGYVYDSSSGYCFQVIHDMTYSGASSACKQSGGTLASVHSFTQNQYLANLASNHVSGNGPYYGWIGFQKQPTGGWAWDDGSVVEFTNWAGGQPFDQAGYTCGVMYTDAIDAPYFGNWTAQGCNQQFKNAFCQVRPS